MPVFVTMGTRHVLAIIPRTVIMAQNGTISTMIGMIDVS